MAEEKFYAELNRQHELKTKQAQLTAAMAESLIAAGLRPWDRMSAGYQMKKMLGAGGFGRVYLVTKGGTKYALKYQNLTGQVKGMMKQIPDHQILAYARVESMYVDSERAVLQMTDQTGMSDHHLVQLIEFGIRFNSDQELEYVTVMEYAPGYPLDDAIQCMARTQYRLPRSKLRTLMIKMLQALRYLHQRDLVHRDVKPANIVWREDGTIKLVDYGLICVAGYTSWKCQGKGGTPYYMAPEYDHGGPKSDREWFRTDLWGMGAVFFMLMIPDRQVYDQARIEMRKKRNSARFNQELDNVQNQYSPELIRVVKQMLSYSSEQRKSADELLQILNFS